MSSRFHRAAFREPSRAELQAIEWDRQARELARSEMQTKFQTITVENFQAACDFFESRRRFHFQTVDR